MRTSSPRFGIPSYILTVLGAVALSATTAKAADLIPQTLPPLTVSVDTWTGFSFGVGGGVGIFNVNVNTFAKRKDTVEQCPPGQLNAGTGTCGGAANAGWVLNETFSNSQNLNINDLGDEGGFGTIQAAYDFQMGSNWVLGAFVDADLYGGMDANAKQVSKSRNDFFAIPIGGNLVDFGANSSLTSKTEIGLDWSISVGGRIGWLATPSTLLYFLAAYTYAELDKARLNVSTDAVFSTDQGGIVPLDGGGCVVFGGCPLALTVNLPKSLDGYTLGGGSEVRLGGGPWSVKFEYRYTHLDGEKARFDKDSAQAFATFSEAVGLRRNAFAKAGAEIDDIDLHTVRAMLAYRF